MAVVEEACMARFSSQRPSLTARSLPLSESLTIISPRDLPPRRYPGQSRGRHVHSFWTLVLSLGGHMLLGATVLVEWRGVQRNTVRLSSMTVSLVAEDKMLPTEKHRYIAAASSVVPAGKENTPTAIAPGAATKPLLPSQAGSSSAFIRNADASAPVDKPALVAETPAPVATEQPVSVPTSVGSSSAKQSAWDEAVLRQFTQRRRNYPSRALLSGLSGMVLIRLIINDRGNLLDVELVRGHGMKPLEDEAIALAVRANPYPPPPTARPGEVVRVLIPIEFALNRKP